MKKNNINKISLLMAILVSIFAFQQNISAQDEESLPLNLNQVEMALLSTKTTAANKKALLIEGVNGRKITFLLTSEIEKRLRSIGANNLLIAAIRKNAPPAARIIQKTSANTTVKNSIGIELVLIPKGEFMMGTEKINQAETVFDAQRPRHKVKINQEFYLGKYEITQAQWKAVMGKNPSLYDLCGENCPVESVSWNNVKKFIEKLNQKNDGFKYRLPSEAEWEYAARAGTGTVYYWGDDLEEKDFRYYVSANGANPVRVGSFLPNGFGLYDMSGNVWELCEDVWQANYKNAPADGSANLAGDTEKRVMRGGSYGNFAQERRSDMRRNFPINEGNQSLGFRVAAVKVNP